MGVCELIITKKSIAVVIPCILVPILLTPKAGNQGVPGFPNTEIPPGVPAAGVVRRDLAGRYVAHQLM
jgi:hypothetical protein